MRYLTLSLVIVFKIFFCITWDLLLLLSFDFHLYGIYFSILLQSVCMSPNLKSVSYWQHISYLEPVCCSMSSSNCCFLTCIQVSQEADQAALYSHLFQNFPQFTVIHTVKGFGIVNKAEINIFLELSCFLDDPLDVGNLISGSSAFSKTSLNIWNFTVHVLLKPGLENFKHYFTSVWDESNCVADWFQIGKGGRQGCILSLCLFNLYAEYIMKNAGLEEVQGGIKIVGRNINNLRYVDDITLMAESEEELKSLLMKVKGESEKLT